MPSGLTLTLFRDLSLYVFLFHGALHPQKLQGLLGMAEWRWGKREILYLSLHCHQQDDSCIKMGGDESQFSCFFTRIKD